MPLDTLVHEAEDKSVITTKYMDPHKLMDYLLNKCPRVLWGTGDFETAIKHCDDFWAAYREYHGTHQIYSSYPNELAYTIPLAVHGDEGRGKRRSQTTVVSYEAVLGLKGHRHCNKCRPSTTQEPLENPIPTARLLKPSFKGHSFVQHFPAFIIPGTLDKEVGPLLEKLMGIFGSSLQQLFHHPIEAHGVKWRFAVIGCKADLKWHSKTCCLIRGYEHQSTRVDAAMCHLCHAGLPGIPAEAVQEGAAWEATVYASRPWSMQKLPMLNAIPFDDSRPEHLYKLDGFHNLRLGVYREFVASSVMPLLRWGYFGENGNLKEKLQRAHGSFKLYLASISKSASLRSFTPAFFNYKNKKSFPWLNAKGSDVTLTMKWLAPLLASAINLNNAPERVEPLNVMLSTARLGVRWFDLVYHHNIFLSRACGATLHEVGTSFVRGYVSMAGFAYRNEHCLYGIKPKLHFQTQTLYELRLQLERGDKNILSPIVWDCQQNEDYIGRFSRMSRKHDLRVMTERVLELWLIKAYVLEKRHRDDGDD